MGCFAFTFMFVVAPFVLGTADTTYVLRSSHVYCAGAWYSAKAFTIVCLIILAVPVNFMIYAYMAIYKHLQKSTTEVKIALLPLPPQKRKLESIRQSEAQRTILKTDFSEEFNSKLANGSSNIASTIEVKGAAQNDLDKQQMILMKQSAVIVASFVLGWIPYQI
ncbi:hypothetical protein HK100_002225, partial [Physocladia obscura]